MFQLVVRRSRSLTINYLVVSIYCITTIIIVQLVHVVNVLIFIFRLNFFNKMKNKKFHTFGRVSKSNRKIIERGKNRQIDTCSQIF
jgi:hypothetical protein